MNGSYQLTGIMETACGLELYPDGNFDFYYSYGAIDRHGYGTWQSAGNEIMLQSDYADQPGFSIAEEKIGAHPFLLVSLQNADPFFAQYMRVFAINGEHSEEKKADGQGRIVFEQARAEKLMVMNDLFPDNIVTLLPVNAEANHIILSASQNLALVHFEQVTCPLSDKGLLVKLPLFSLMYGERDFYFIKRNV